ncbi:MAG: xylulokinase [Nitrososphaeria archaeon]
MYVISYDLGTTGNKATLFSIDGKLLASTFCPYKTLYPAPNQAEQDPNEWWESIKTTTLKLLNRTRVDSNSIKVISISGQMMGVVPVDRKGFPLRNAIIWADQRSVFQVKKVLEKMSNEKIYKLTGSRITPTYFGPKVAWIKDNEPEIYRRTYKFLFPKDFIVYKLTGIFGTDYTDASMSNIFDIKKLTWSDEIVDALGIDLDKLPDPRPSTEIVGKLLPNIAQELGLSTQVMVVRGAGDGPSATVGAGIVDSNEAYIYLGSSSWISTCSNEPFYDPYARTFNFLYPLSKAFCPTGTMQAGGASYEWFKNVFCRYESEIADILGSDTYAILDFLIDQTFPGSKGLIFLPYILGERSPYWNPNARGAFIGISILHSKADFIRAVLEGVAMNLRIILDIFENEGKFKFEKIKLIGGGAQGKKWRQIIANVFQRPIVLTQHPLEATSIGAAIIGVIGAGLLSKEESNAIFVRDLIMVEPQGEFFTTYEKLYEVFKKTYQVLVEVFEELSKIQNNINGGENYEV